MSTKLVLAAAALLASGSALAATFNGGTVADVDPPAELLNGLHAADLGPFNDTFDFVMTADGQAAAQFLEGAFDLSGDVSASPFVFTGLLLVDASNNLLPGAFAFDTDGSDGWQVFASIPGAGTYRVLLQGLAPFNSGDPTQTMFYVGILSSQVNAVPEPASYGLMGLGLLGLAALRRRT